MRALLRAIKYKEECGDLAEIRGGSYKKVNTKDATTESTNDQDDGLRSVRNSTQLLGQQRLTLCAG